MKKNTAFNLTMKMMCASSSFHTKNTVHQCPLCRVNNKNLKKHVYSAHLPYSWDPHLCCWECNMFVGLESALKKKHLNDHPHTQGFKDL